MEKNESAAQYLKHKRNVVLEIKLMIYEKYLSLYKSLLASQQWWEANNVFYIWRHLKFGSCASKLQ